MNNDKDLAAWPAGQVQDPAYKAAQQARNEKASALLGAVATHPTPAVDLSGLTRAYNSGYKAGHHDTVEAQYTDIAQCDMYTYHSDVVAELVADGTLSAPVVREGKMTDELAIIKAVQEHLVDVVRSFGDVSCAAYISTWHKPEQIAAKLGREVLATGKGDAPTAVSMLSGALNHARDALRFYAEQDHFVRYQPDEWDAVSGEPQNFYEDSNNTATVEDGSVAKQALENIAHVEAYAAAATPSTPSQAWEGELPKLPQWAWHDESAEKRAGAVHFYTGDQMHDYARKAIGAAVAGVRDAALEEAANVCAAIYQDHRDQYKGRGKYAPNNPRRADPHCDGCADGAAECEEAIRSLSSNPVSLTEWPVGQVAKPEYKAEQQARNERARDRLHALAHPASNGNGEKGGA